MPKFLCTGDLHLGAGADLLDGDERLAEQEAVWLSVVKMANELGATILFAGDAWERRRPTPVELLAFKGPLHWLKHPLIGIAGNHDVEAFERPTGYDVFLLPDGSGRAAVYSRPKVVSTGGALVACLPWAQPAKLVALEGGGDRDAILARLGEGLLDVARGLFAEIEIERASRRENGASSPTPAILLTHWSISGSTSSSGAPVDLFREVVLPIGELEAIGFDAIVAGHIHRPQMLGERGFYVGSPMPLNFGEAGHDHVVWLLDFPETSSEDPVRPVEMQAFQIPIASRRLVTIDYDYADAGQARWLDAAVDHPEMIDPELVGDAVVKLRIRATEEQARRLDLAKVKAALLAAGARKVWAIQVEREREELVRGVAVDETLGDVEAMELYLEAEGHDEDRLEGLLERHVAYLERLQA